MVFVYSVLKLFIGFDIAALIAWKLIVANAITTAIKVVIANTCQPMVVL
jgi:hypothetical protein